MIHKTTRSILSVLLAALLLVTSIPLTPAFADGGAVSLQSESAEGRVLEQVDGVYQIGSAEELREFAELVNDDGETTANAILTDDIDLNNQLWTPIGNEEHLYTGTFDGANYTISGLYIDSNADYQGLFGYVSGIGKVQNLSVSGSVKGNDYVGGIAGQNNGNVINCAFSGSVSGNSSVGGVVGYNSSSGTVKNCYNTGAVSGNYVGGVVGYNGGTVENCYNTGAVNSSGNRVGGVVGWNDLGASVDNCYNTGAVNSSGNRVGGVVGSNRGRVENCYNTGEVSGSGNYVGGVVGYNEGGIGNVTGCYFLQQNPVIPGIGNGRGDATSVTTLNELCDAFKNDTTNTWIIHPVLGRPVLNKNWEGGLGTDKSPYEISTADELENFRDIVNRGGAGANAHAKLMNDINLNGNATNQWIPIGNIISGDPYEGTFNGAGHTISGLYIKNTSNDTDYQGLFGRVNGGTVKDLTVSGNVSGGMHVGGIVGYNGTGATVSNCYNTGQVNGSDHVGGVVGLNSGTVENCYNTDSVKGDWYVGGVVGRNYGSVQNSYNTGTVSGLDSVSGSYVGGVVGWNVSSGNVKNCYNTGSVSGPDSGTGNRVGGVVGYNRGTVENCYNTGSVTGVTGVTGSSDYVGGVVGYNRGTVKNCYNTGTVQNLSVSGTVSGKMYVGGVVGYNNGGSVTGCYFLQQNGVPEQGFGEGSGDATAKDDTAFHSGEVAWRLQNGQTAGEEDPIPQVWGQSNLTATTSLPTLVALDKNAKPVYKVAFISDNTEIEAQYANSGMTVTIPAAPSREGHTFTGWSDGTSTYQAGAKVEITSDTKFTAQWTKDTVNYTVTVSADPEAGGTVSGSGEYSEGTQVTVTATPATGYHFVNWTENGTEVSTEATFTFNATVDRNLIAIFAKNEEPTPTPTPTPDPEPSGPSTGDSTGWDDIRDELENAENGDEITIDMGDETKVPAEIFESLAGKDVEISFDLGDIQWSVNGADIPTDTDFTDLDLGADLDTHGIPVNVINTITGEVGTVQITLAHDGEFGFTMTLTAPLGKENAGYWANLYHYDEDAEALNFEAAAKIDEDGSVTIPFSHASQYAIVIDTHSHAAVDVSDLFIDIAPDAWYKDAVQYAYDQGLMTGVSDREFAPEQTTTRAMIVSILARLEGVTTAQAAGFADVNDNDWYATAVNWAASVGVVNGYEDNTFQPNTAITREQLAAILMNYAAYKGEDVSARADLTSYTDQPSTWAQEAMQWAVAEKLITGVTNDELQPQSSATRAQVAAILQRYLEA